MSAYGIIIQDGAILLCRLSQTIDPRQRYTLPGGGLDFGEAPADAVLRELREETGFDVSVGDLLGIDNLVFESKGIIYHNIRIVYRAQIIGGKLTHEQSGSTDRCEWIPLKNLRETKLVELVENAIKWISHSSDCDNLSN